MYIIFYYTTYTKTKYSEKIQEHKNQHIILINIINSINYFIKK